jgi:hypothetical protein
LTLGKCALVITGKFLNLQEWDVGIEFEIVNRFPFNLDNLMSQWQKNPQDDNCKMTIQSIIGGPAPSSKSNYSS